MFFIFFLSPSFLIYSEIFPYRGKHFFWQKFLWDVFSVLIRNRLRNHLLFFSSIYELFFNILKNYPKYFLLMSEEQQQQQQQQEVQIPQEPQEPQVPQEQEKQVEQEQEKDLSQVKDAEEEKKEEGEMKEEEKEEVKEEDNGEKKMVDVNEEKESEDAKEEKKDEEMNVNPEEKKEENVEMKEKEEENKEEKKEMEEEEKGGERQELSEGENKDDVNLNDNTEHNTEESESKEGEHSEQGNNNGIIDQIIQQYNSEKNMNASTNSNYPVEGHDFIPPRDPSPSMQDSLKLNIVRINKSTTEEGLRQFFSIYGTVTSVLLKDGFPFNYAFVGFAQKETADRVLSDGRDGKIILDGQVLEVRTAIPKGQRQHNHNYSGTNPPPRGNKLFIGGLHDGATQGNIISLIYTLFTLFVLLMILLLFLE